MEVENEAGKNLKSKNNSKGMQIFIVSDGSYDDYVSLTDIVKYKSEDPAAIIQNWMGRVIFGEMVPTFPESL